MIKSKTKVENKEFFNHLNNYIKDFMVPIQKMDPNKTLVNRDLVVKKDIFNKLLSIPHISKSKLTTNFCELSDMLTKLDNESVDYKLEEQINDFILNKTFKDSFEISGNSIVLPKDESLKKITNTTLISDYEVETPDGWVSIDALHETIEYQVYELTLNDGKKLKCADNHIIINSIGDEVFVKDLIEGDEVITNNGLSKVLSVIDLGYKEVMYDLELDKGSDRVYYTNGILSHNTYLSKVLAKNVFGDEDALIRVDMSEYMEKFSMSKLIGAPPGYVGYGEGGKLTEAVRRRPYSVILFDEIEKAHDDVFNLLLQLLDEGHLTDSNDRKVDFKNALIIMTSNIGVKELSQFGKGIGFESKNSIVNEEERSKKIIQKALKDKFKPEFLNRIDETIIFNSLKQEDIDIIIKNEIDIVKNRIKDSNYELIVNKSAMDFIAKEGYHKEYGARPLKRAIQKYVEDPITDEIMDGNLKDGGTIKLSYSKTKGITTKVTN